MPFELTLSGIKENDKVIIKEAINEIMDGNVNSAKEILEKSKIDYSSMFKEIEQLSNSGYQLSAGIDDMILQFVK